MTTSRVTETSYVNNTHANWHTFEHVTMIPSLKRKWRTASQWCINVLTISPVCMLHTLNRFITAGLITTTTTTIHFWVFYLTIFPTLLQISQKQIFEDTCWRMLKARSHSCHKRWFSILSPVSDPKNNTAHYFAGDKYCTTSVLNTIWLFSSHCTSKLKWETEMWKTCNTEIAESVQTWR